MKPSLATSLAPALIALLLGTPAFAKPDPKPAAATRGDEPLVQIAVLLDTSNSMDGLIAQAKTQLWKIVNEFARARRGGRAPRLEVALYEYGNDGLSSATGHLRRVVPLTTDLDRISEQLFALRTNGGEEYCGKVIDTATRELEWSSAPGTLKMIFIAGNEPFTQGPVSYEKAVKQAVARGILVNTIFCGDEKEGANSGWRHGALLADGRYSFIDSNRAVAHVAAPQDAELARLGSELNKTYIAYGAAGEERKERQAVQDKNAEAAGAGASVGRAAAKASANYRNDDWDLVDATRSGSVKVAEVPATALPAEMRAMSPEQRKTHVEKVAKEREELQAKIRKLESERRAYVEAEEKKQAAAGAATFDSAVLGAVRDQASRAKFDFVE